MYVSSGNWAFKCVSDKFVIFDISNIFGEKNLLVVLSGSNMFMFLFLQDNYVVFYKICCLYCG